MGQRDTVSGETEEEFLLSPVPRLNTQGRAGNFPLNHHLEPISCPNASFIGCRKGVSVMRTALKVERISLDLQ